ncbi:MAG: hypothetical protein QW718_07325, partial [Nitrososphaerota archaeon]
MSKAIEERKTLREVFTLTRMVIFNLKAFLDTEDHKYFKRAYKLVEYAASRPQYSENIYGFRDLYNNMKSMHDLIESKNWNLTGDEYSKLSEQVVYTMVRANI